MKWIQLKAFICCFSVFWKIRWKYRWDQKNSSSHNCCPATITFAGCTCSNNTSPCRLGCNASWRKYASATRRCWHLDFPGDSWHRDEVSVLCFYVFYFFPLFLSLKMKQEKKEREKKYRMYKESISLTALPYICALDVIKIPFDAHLWRSRSKKIIQIILSSKYDTY